MPASRRANQNETTDRIRRHWDRQAPRYDRMMSRMERLFLEGSREWLCSRADGNTLEVAVGTGRNLPYYPDTVHLTGIDLSPGMLNLARERAHTLGAQVDLREANAQHLPFADASFDTVVCALSLCTVPDLDASVAEMHRVLRPGGQLLLVDHVRPTSLPVRWLLLTIQGLMNVFDPGNGEQMMRRPLLTVREYGFVVEERDRFKAGVIERLVARKPE